MTNHSEILDIIIKKQMTLNDITFPIWRTELNTDNWISAIIHETVEWNASLAQHKWWKKEVQDLENCKMEVTDIFFFYISYLYSINPDRVKDNLATITNTFAVDYNSNRVLKNFLNSIINQTNDINKYFYQLMVLSEMTTDDLFKIYFAKNVLNTFRQANGYKDGTYIKIWNGKEDNVAVMDALSTFTLDENLEANLYQALTKYYAYVLEENKKGI
jgi:hypothetical protein